MCNHPIVAIGSVPAGCIGRLLLHRVSSSPRRIDERILSVSVVTSLHVTIVEYEHCVDYSHMSPDTLLSQLMDACLSAGDPAVCFTFSVLDVLDCN